MTSHVFPTMGTMVSLRCPELLEPEALHAVEAVFDSYDRDFSLYNDATPLSRLARNEITLADTDERIRDTYALALEWRNRTGSAFTPHRPDGVIDLSGVVKALAIADAGTILDAHTDNWLINVGGDVLTRGTHENGQPWTVGLVDPEKRDHLAGLAEITAPRRAVATSGTAERGEHIWRRSAPTFVQATVAANDIVTADVLATTIIAGIEDDLDALTFAYDIDVLTVDADGNARATPAARSWMQRHTTPHRDS